MAICWVSMFPYQEPSLKYPLSSLKIFFNSSVCSHNLCTHLHTCSRAWHICKLISPAVPGYSHFLLRPLPCNKKRFVSVRQTGGVCPFLYESIFSRLSIQYFLEKKTAKYAQHVLTELLLLTLSVSCISILEYFFEDFQVSVIV